MFIVKKKEKAKWQEQFLAHQLWQFEPNL